MLDTDRLYKQLVSNCKICGGVGSIIESETNLHFCDCMKFYMFIVQMVQKGFPIKYIYDYSENNIKTDRIFFTFGNDDIAFNSALKRVKDGYRLQIRAVDKCYEITDVIRGDGVMIYNIGLESNSLHIKNLMRLIKEVDDNQLVGIFAFTIREKAAQKEYPDWLLRKVNEYRKYAD